MAGAYAGLRPLLTGDGRTADLSRGHAVVGAPDGVQTIAGGKPTTYRRMAEDAVDADDLLDRRTRIGLVPEDRAAALPVAERVLRDHA